MNYACVHSIYLNCTGSLVIKKLKGECEKANEELHFGTLVPFKNHADGFKVFPYNVIAFSSDPVPKHFAEAFEAVVGDTKLEAH